eukprot:sb/3476767/
MSSLSTNRTKTDIYHLNALSLFPISHTKTHSLSLFRILHILKIKYSYLPLSRLLYNFYTIILSPTISQKITKHPRIIHSRNRPIRTRYLGHVTGYQPIRDQHFLIRSVPARHSS